MGAWFRVCILYEFHLWKTHTLIRCIVILLLSYFVSVSAMPGLVPNISHMQGTSIYFISALKCFVDCHPNHWHKWVTVLPGGSCSGVCRDGIVGWQEGRYNNMADFGRAQLCANQNSSVLDNQLVTYDSSCTFIWPNFNFPRRIFWCVLSDGSGIHLSYAWWVSFTFSMMYRSRWINLLWMIFYTHATSLSLNVVC